jgi:hypothetical protein
MLTARHLAFCSVGVALLAYSLFHPGAVHAEWQDGNLYFQKELGWHFYRNDVVPVPPPLPQALPAPPPPLVEATPEPEAKPATPVDIPKEGPALEAYLAALPDTALAPMLPKLPASAIRTWIPVLMDQALTSLDRTGVRKYLLIQQESLRRSELFSRVWQEVIWTDPTFDKTNTMPLGGVGQQVYEQGQATDDRQKVQALQDRITLLIVVQPNCPACEMAWQITKGFGDRYRFTIRPIAADLTTLADGTAVLPYPRIVDSLQITEFPSLFLLEPSTHYLTRLGTGILSEQELATRVLRLIPEANPEGAVTHAWTTEEPAAPAR